MEISSAYKKLLIAAVHLEERGLLQFTEQDLILEAWKLYPEIFGLKGFEEEHPCSQSVRFRLCGRKGLRLRGYLYKENNNQYILTCDGRNRAHKAAKRVNVSLGKHAPTPVGACLNGLPKEVNRFVDRVLSTIAFEKSLRSSEEVRISLEEALQLWNIPTTAKGALIDAYLDEFTAELDKWARLMLASNGEVVLPNGRSVSTEDLGGIRAVDKALRQQFVGALGLLRSRR